ncbi:lasso peptide biosynthesis B2 protein [Terrisporobacter vanillatitrophus]|uniref:lasso peptide biosynthesis B2 protein n=1 Tax=Terrisporobacter vanillatitrophus TaxID=3058402 RepID=UPI003365FDCD
MKKIFVLLKCLWKLLFQFSIEDKILFTEAFILSGIMRFKVLNIPFKKIKTNLGTYNEESAKEVSIEDYKIARKIGNAVINTCNYTPWESLCLVQSMTVQKMLKRRKVSSTLYLGVNKDDKNDMKAHSWIRCGELFITGGDGSNYATVAKFCKQ